jgi:hypothetical protein
MRPLICLWLLLAPGPANAWDTAPHQRITKAAVDSLPRSVLDRFGAETGPLIEIYCMLPDRYTEMESFGFVRKSPGPRTSAEIRPYCVRPDGQLIHGATGDRDSDAVSLVYLLERILTSFSKNQPAEAARYAGVLSHFIADSLSPPHAVTAGQLREMAPPTDAGSINVHAAIEKSLPGFSLGGRAPRAASTHVVDAADAVLARCYAGAARNRKDLPVMVKAACARDERTLDTYRLRAGVTAAEILADALYTLSRMGEDAH